jgi:hypothetical protein
VFESQAGRSLSFFQSRKMALPAFIFDVSPSGDMFTVLQGLLEVLEHDSDDETLKGRTCESTLIPLHWQLKFSQTLSGQPILLNAEFSLASAKRENKEEQKKKRKITTPTCQIFLTSSSS